LRSFLHLHDGFRRGLWYGWNFFHYHGGFGYDFRLAE
jgi:hypothetical protein